MATLMSSTFLQRNDIIHFSFRKNYSNHPNNKIKTTPCFAIFHPITKKPSNQTRIKNPQTTPKKSSLGTIFKKFDDFIVDFIDTPLPPFLDPNHVLSGNFSPVDEVPPTACPVVEGTVPTCLHGGAYIRNGPNPRFIPRGPYHMFEGDGMLHMIKFSHDGQATFCCRYVNTHKHAVEREMGYPFVPSIFSSFDGGLLATVSRFLITTARVVAGQFDPINCGFGSANTSLALFSGRLFALCECDLPYAVSVTAEGDIVTLGRHDFGDPRPLSRMTAHPKVDGATGEVFAYEYDVVPPFLTYFRIDAGGRRQKGVPIHSIERCVATHDFAVTENYAVIPDVQIVVNPWLILRGRSPAVIDTEKVARLGIIPRYAEDEAEMVWVEAAGVTPMHYVNAWEEDGGDTVCVVATNPMAVDQLFENIGLADMRVELIVVNVKEKTLKRHTLSPQFLEFAVINPAYALKKCRYVYSIIGSEIRSLGVVKLDLSLVNKEVAGGGDCTVASLLYEPSCHGGEPFFVAREPDNPAAEEDDGYLVTFVYDDKTQESKFIVMDAKSPNLDIIAAVKLPQRIPTGFHGLFVSENDLTKLTN